MSDLTAIIKNTALANGEINPVITNNPARYVDRQRQYFDPETRTFTQRMAKYSSDFVSAQVQGIYENAPQEWGTYRIRLSNVVRPSSAIQRHYDDYKNILFECKNIEYIRQGTKIVTMGSTWLAINPDNTSGASGTGLIRRCNAVWNHLDYYGNVVSEPIIVENFRANANDADAQQSLLITKGYFNIICQYNDDTRQIDTNTRFILGSAAYRVTGYSDFEQEFTGDYSAVRLLYFSVRYEEPNYVVDDMENHVAGGKDFSWEVLVSGQANMSVGATTQLGVQSKRNGEIVTSTAENPISYEWESSNESVITVDQNGYVEAVGEGTASVRVKLVQNTVQHENFFITVTQSADGVEFKTTVPQTLGAYETVNITAAYFEDGVEMPQLLTWDFTGADENAYSANVSDNSVALTCFGYSATPLTITASYGAYAASTTIEMEGI